MADLTVIIPTCDRGERLPIAVDSVLHQTDPPVRVIIVDNGVAANTCRFADGRCEIVRTDPRVGPGKARNIGAVRASTDYIAFLDDDDYWHPSYVERTMARFRSETAIDVVLGRVNRRRRDGVERRYKLFPEDVEAQREVFFRNPGFGGQNITIRRTLFLSIGGFDDRMPASEDRDLAARLLRAGAMIRVASDAVAVLCDHDEVRARQRQLRGNAMFIRKHWRQMRWNERVAACRTLAKRWLNNRNRRSTFA